jgi:hypothetical protein
MLISELLCESGELRAGLRVLGTSPAPAAAPPWRPPAASAGPSALVDVPELLEVARRFDVSEDDTLVLRLDYVEAVVRKPSWL